MEVVIFEKFCHFLNMHERQLGLDESKLRNHDLVFMLVRLGVVLFRNCEVDPFLRLLWENEF